MRRVKNNKYTKIIDDELDLHGMTTDEALVAIEVFLNQAHRNEYKHVRIITGKGINSPDGISVLRPVAEQWLHEQQYGFVTAKSTEGGEGALVVEVT